MKRLFIQMLSGLLVATIVIFLYFFLPKDVKLLDDRLRDYMFMVRGPIPTQNQVVIVDIDEKSLQQMGQWPWPRKKFAQVLNNLNEAGAGIIGLDIVFAEEDNANPVKVLGELGYDTTGVEDYDAMVSEAILNTPTVPGIIFKLTEENPENESYKMFFIDAIFQYTDISTEPGCCHDTITEKVDAVEQFGQLESVEEFAPAPMEEVAPQVSQEELADFDPFQNKNVNRFDLTLAKDTVSNIAKIQGQIDSFGFFNSFPDEDGIVRRVPLAMNYKDFPYPSLSLEMLRRAKGSNMVEFLYSKEFGMEYFRIIQDIDGGKKTLTEYIPVDPTGQFIVNFRGPSYTFPYIPAVDIYNKDFDPERIRGKYVLIGTSAQGLLDLRAMPYEAIYPGVEIHANIIDNVLAKDFFRKPTWSVLLDVVLILVIAVSLAAILGFTGAFTSLVVVGLYFAGLFSMNYYLLFKMGLITNIFFPIVLTVTLVYILSNVLNYFLETKQKNMIKGKFASKVSPAVMEEILKNADQNVLAEEEREITVFFSDVRNFTNISEAMGNPKRLIEFMNAYMDPMTEIIVKSNGTVDKFIGDAIMAYWNAPQHVDDHADRALSATLDQLHALKPLNEKLRQDPRFANVVTMADEMGKPIIDIGIGLNTGVAIVGEMGSTGRSDYTVIGDPINLGSRLESLCKYYNSHCNISSFTKAQLTGSYIFRYLDMVTVKGKHEPVEIWQVIDYEKPPQNDTLYDVSRERLDDELARYNEAIILYKDSRFADALPLFKELEARPDKTNQAIYKIYIERCEHYIAEPPEHFNGVFVHTSKG